MTKVDRKGLRLKKKGFGIRLGENDGGTQGRDYTGQREAENSNTGNLDGLDKIGCAVGHLLG